ncbi:hypothetical protein RJT34_03182 [Clitoria ternatea]|uniref:RRM domain-containing protein n=1 Tax=Clitoria ternatea TaxID=43366 RepID=A0AAN9KJ05_CLITE
MVPVRCRDKKEAAEPEADPEKDQRTVFAYQMPLKATEKDVYEFFSKAGKVSRFEFDLLLQLNCDVLPAKALISVSIGTLITSCEDVRLIMDRYSRCFKGVGQSISATVANPASVYLNDTSNKTQLELAALEFLFPYISLLYALYIKFYDAMLVPMAIALSGELLLGQPVMVKPSESEKNLVQSNGAGDVHVVICLLLCIYNLYQIFEPFGPVEVVQLPLDLETGHCKGFGFVQFAHLEYAKAAQSLNGKLEIAGRTIEVSC